MGLPAASQSGWRAVVQKEADSYLLSASHHVGDLRPATGVTVNGSVPNTFGPSALPVGAWTHLAMTYDGAALRLYVNGVQVASTLSGNITPTTNPLSIGGNSPYGEYFEGRIDEVRRCAGGDSGGYGGAVGWAAGYDGSVAGVGVGGECGEFEPG